MSHHHYSAGEMLLAELATAGVVGHFVASLTLLPGWVGGVVGGLFVGVVLRLLDVPLRQRSERLAKRWTPTPAAPPRVAPVDPPDDPDATG